MCQEMQVASYCIRVILALLTTNGMGSIPGQELRTPTHLRVEKTNIQKHGQYCNTFIKDFNNGPPHPKKKKKKGKSSCVTCD